MSAEDELENTNEYIRDKEEKGLRLVCDSTDCSLKCMFPSFRAGKADVVATALMRAVAGNVVAHRDALLLEVCLKR